MDESFFKGLMGEVPSLIVMAFITIKILSFLTGLKSVVEGFHNNGMDVIKENSEVLRENTKVIGEIKGVLSEITHCPNRRRID